MGFSLNDVKQSNYLTKDDVGEQGWNLTISGVSMEMLEADGKEEQKLTLHFVENEYMGKTVKPIVCNVENFMRVCKVRGVDPNADNVTDSWPGTQVNIFNDPYVSFGTRQTGGIRVRPPQVAQVQQAGPQSFEQAIDQTADTGPDWT